MEQFDEIMSEENFDKVPSIYVGNVGVSVKEIDGHFFWETWNDYGHHVEEIPKSLYHELIKLKVD